MAQVVEQADVDHLIRDLEGMRRVLSRDRTALRPQLEAMIWRAREMRERAAGGSLENSVTTAHDLLLNLRQGAAAEPIAYAWRKAG